MSALPVFVVNLTLIGIHSISSSTKSTDFLGGLSLIPKVRRWIITLSHVNYVNS